MGIKNILLSSINPLSGSERSLYKCKHQQFYYPVLTLACLHHGLKIHKYIGNKLKICITIVLCLFFNDWHFCWHSLYVYHRLMRRAIRKKMFILFPSYGMWHTCLRTTDNRWRSRETGSYTIVKISVFPVGRKPFGKLKKINK